MPQIPADVDRIQDVLSAAVNQAYEEMADDPVMRIGEILANDQLALLRSRNSELEAQVSLTASTAKAHKASLDEAQEVNSTLRAELAASCSAVARLEEQLATRAAEVSDLTREMDALRSMLTEVHCEGAEGGDRAEDETDSAPVRSDPASEAKLFFAAGYDVRTREHVQPDVSAVRAVLSSSAVAVNCRDGLGTPPISHAAYVGADDVVLALFEAGADLNAENLDGATPLHMCVYNHQPRTAAILLACGAEPDAVMDDAAAVGKPDILSLLQAAHDGEAHAMLDDAIERVQAVRIPAC